MCGCNKGGATAKRYQVKEANGTVHGPYATHLEAVTKKRAIPGSKIEPVAGTAK